MNKKALSLLLLSATFLCACSSGGGGDTPGEPEPTPSQKTDPSKLKINIGTSVSDVTRVSGNSFESGDQVGLFVVNRNTDGTAATLALTGNHVDNVCFTYSGVWTPATTVYWKDATTHADFYLYYPYSASLSSVTAMSFSISADQSTEAAYEACDLLAGSATNIAPTEAAVTINVKHLMSQVIITVEPGNGFTAESLAAAELSVTVNGTKTAATADIAMGTLTATGEATAITPLNTTDGYKAFIVPQTVEECNLITVTVDGREFNYQKSFTFVGGKLHRFTIKPSKTSSGVNVNITGWDDDGTDNGGTAE